MSDGKARNKRTRNLVSLAAALAVLTAGAAFWAWQRADAPDDGAATCRAVLSELGVESTGSVHACGDALETAMTGKPAGAKAASAPTERMPEARSRNFEKVVSAFTKDVAPGEADIPEAIRGNVANAVTYYTDDVFQILTGQVDYSNEIDSTIPNDIDLSPETLSDFLRPLAADEEAFDSIRASVFRRIDSDIASLDKADLTRAPKPAPGEPDMDDARGVAIGSGSVTGVLRGLSGEALTVKYGKGTEQRMAALERDVERFGLPRLMKAFITRAESVGVPDPSDSGSRFGDILYTAESSYRARSGGY